MQRLTSCPIDESAFRSKKRYMKFSCTFVQLLQLVTHAILVIHRPERNNTVRNLKSQIIITCNILNVSLGLGGCCAMARRFVSSAPYSLTSSLILPRCNATGGIIDEFTDVISRWHVTSTSTCIRSTASFCDAIRMRLEWRKLILRVTLLSLVLLVLYC